MTLEDAAPTALRQASKETTQQASLAFSCAESDLRGALSCSALELDIVLALFISDELTQGTQCFSWATLLQAACSWPERGIPEWTAFYEDLYRKPEFIEYRKRRDVMASALALQRALENMAPTVE